MIVTHNLKDRRVLFCFKECICIPADPRLVVAWTSYITVREYVERRCFPVSIGYGAVGDRKIRKAYHRRRAIVRRYITTYSNWPHHCGIRGTTQALWPLWTAFEIGKVSLNTLPAWLGRLEIAARDLLLFDRNPVKQQPLRIVNCHGECG